MIKKIKFTDKKCFKKLNFNPFSTKDLHIDEDIDPETNLFNDKKESNIRFCLLYSRRFIKLWKKPFAR